MATSCSRRSRSSAAATTKVAAEQLTAGAGQQDGHVDKLPRVAKSWKCVFFKWGFRRDVRPRGLSLQGTIPSLSAMVFSRPGGAFLEAICVTKRFGNQLQQAQQKQRSRSSAAATTKVAAEQLTAGAGQQDGHVDKLPRAAKSWKCVFLTGVSEGTLGLVDYHCRAPFFEAICWLNDVANSCSSCSRSRAAATTKVAAEQLTLPRAAKCWKFVFPSSSSFRGMVFPLRRSVPWCFPVREVHFWRQFVG